MYVSKHNDVISGIGIGIAAADSIGYRVSPRYRSNPIPVHQTVAVYDLGRSSDVAVHIIADRCCSSWLAVWLVVLH